MVFELIFCGIFALFIIAIAIMGLILYQIDERTNYSEPKPSFFIANLIIIFIYVSTFIFFRAFGMAASMIYLFWFSLVCLIGYFLFTGGNMISSPGNGSAPVADAILGGALLILLWEGTFYVFYKVFLLVI